MGFHLTITGVKAMYEEKIEECSGYPISQRYYFLTADGRTFWKKLGEHYNLDLALLEKHLYADDYADYYQKEGYLNDWKIEINYILPIVRQLREHLIDELNIISKLNIFQTDLMKNYTSSKIFLDDLTSITQSMECHKSKGEAEIYLLII